MLLTDQTDQAVSGRPRRTPLLVAASALLALGLGAAIATAGGGGGKPTPVKHKTTLALKAPAGGGGVSLGSCIMFSVGILKDMPLAFGGTVTDVGGGTVTLAVDRWFKGGSADVVTVAERPGNTSVGTVEFFKGKRYLVTATNGTVNSCGYTGEASPDLERSFEDAFPR